MEKIPAKDTFLKLFLRDRSLFSGGGRATIFEGRVTIFLSHIGEGHFFIKVIEGRATIFWSWVFSHVLYNEKSGYWPSLPLLSYPFIISAKGACFGYTHRDLSIASVSFKNAN